ncbi:hypothetical protein GCM10027018_21610 [Paenibacillus thermoaerophilus]
MEDDRHIQRFLAAIGDGETVLILQQFLQDSNIQLGIVYDENFRCFFHKLAHRFRLIYEAGEHACSGGFESAACGRQPILSAND